MKIKLIDRKIGYWVGFGDLNQKQINEIEKLELPNGTWKIEGFDSYVGVWTDNDSKVWTEKSRWFADFSIAYKWGKIRKEQAIWDCKNSQNIWLIEQFEKKNQILHVKYKEFEYWIYDD